MRKGRNQIPNQLCLEVNVVNPESPAEICLEGLVEALADLLLEAMGAARSAKKGGVDEHQNHA
jgi:hypothetical protein